MNKLKFVFCSIIIVTTSILPQQIPGAVETAISHSGVALSNDVFALFNNPAGLAQLKERSIGVYYSPAPFGLKEFSNGFIAYSEPFKFGAISIGGMTYGFDLFRENKLTIGLSYKYQKKIYFGVSINYQTVSIKRYGASNALYFSIGSLTYLSKKIRWGFAIDNINRASYGNTKDQIPLIYKTGFSYDYNKTLSVNISIEKDIKYNPSLHFGMIYDIVKNLSIRSGFSNNPTSYSAGVGIKYATFNIGYSVYTHQTLGLTHQFGVTINFGTK